MSRPLHLTLALVVAVGLVAPTAALAGKKKKGPAEGPAPVGWYKQEGWLGECWNPPKFDELATGPRRLAWQETRNAMMQQWQGQKGDGISFDETVIVNLETALLAKPERIEQVARDNHEQCKSAMSGKGAGGWESWINALPGQLTAGECSTPPLDYTLFDYLNIGVEWQIPAGVCKGDHINVRASEADYYRIVEKGTWINASGDATQPATGSLPCNIEGCFKGQLVMRFTGESGVVTVKPVGTGIEFLAPEHGKIEVMINDDSWNDNVWKVESGIEHHTQIEYSPVKK